MIEPIDVDPGAMVAPQLGPRPLVAADAPGFGQPEPQAFLVRLSATSPTLPVHFHVVDQFQWFVRGGCRFGVHAVGIGAVHYADRYSPYGPISPGPEGVSFSTMRAVSDSGAHYMPEQRDELRVAFGADRRRAAHRNQSWNVLEVAVRPHRWCDLVADPDGLRVAVTELEEGEAVPSTVIGGRGGYLVVASGSVVEDDMVTGPGALAWKSGHLDQGAVVAMAPRTRLALLQFPRPAR